jgi:hypothetical protein
MDYNLSTNWTIALLFLVVWDLAWKGVALWKAGRNDDLGWFIALLVINSAGILPIIYLLTHRHQDSNKEDKIHYKQPVSV